MPFVYEQHKLRPRSQTQLNPEEQCEKTLARTRSSSLAGGLVYLRSGQHAAATTTAQREFGPPSTPGPEFRSGRGEQHKPGNSRPRTRATINPRRYIQRQKLSTSGEPFPPCPLGTERW